MEAVSSEHNLSRRALVNFPSRDVWGPREKSMGKPWSKKTPEGTVILRLAENSLMHDEVAEYISRKIAVSPTKHLTYSTGSRGSLHLRRTIATFMENEFHARDSISTDQLLITSGVASALDSIAWAVCDEGEAILVPRPYYNGFHFDLLNRSNAHIVGVGYADVEGYNDVDDLFDAQVNRTALENALSEAKKSGIIVRALLISNPHNPLGRCYPPATLQEFATFCGSHGLHFISDEIYAKSVFRDSPKLHPFTSVLSLDLEDKISSTNVHVLYGASKDFCANGLRLGVIHSRNDGVIGAISSISMLSWSPNIIQDVWSSMLEDKVWLDMLMETKAARMQHHYQIMTAFLQEQGINFLEINAGLFVWIDLRPLLKAWMEARALKIALVDLHPFELRVAEVCNLNGVLVAPGHIYMSEAPGWFRLTFTVEEGALIEGLARFRKSLDVLRTEAGGRDVDN